MPVQNAIHPAMLCLTQSVLTAYKHGNQIKRVTINYGSDNDVLLREESHTCELSSVSDSQSDSEVGRRIYTRLTPSNVEGNRQPVPKGGHDFTMTEKKAHRAGVRRKRRWMNDYFIGEQLNKFLPQDEEEAKREWLQLFVPEEKSMFQQIMEDDRQMRKFRKFIDISPDNQEKLLREMKPITEVTPRYHSTPAQKFNSLGKTTINVLRQAPKVPSRLVDPCAPTHRSDVLSHIDTVIRHYLTKNEIDSKPLRLLLPDAFHRHACHGVAEFYSAACYSKTQDGDRLTFVKHRRVSDDADERVMTSFWLRSRLCDHVLRLNDCAQFESPTNRRNKKRKRAPRSRPAPQEGAQSIPIHVQLDT
jgi:hypothetical protein